MSSETGRLLDGKKVAAKLQERTARRAAEFHERVGRPPGLVAVLVGDDPASGVYVARKEETARSLGLAGRAERRPADTSGDDVLRLVASLNEDDAVDGILVQLPLPSQVDESAVLAAVHPDKDVDGFHPVNVGRLHLGLPAPRPCTPAGILSALDEHEVPLEGRHAVVVGRSNIVGKPLAALLLARHATVTTCHSRTRDLPGTCRSADVLLVAVGRPGLVGADWVRPGSVVIDVGTNRIESPGDDELAERLFGANSPRWRRYRERGHALVGDVDFRAAREVAGLITPVPGGVGPLTIAQLMANTVEAAARRAGVSLGSDA